MDAKGLITAEANVKSYDYARQLRLDAVKTIGRNLLMIILKNHTKE